MLYRAIAAVQLYHQLFQHSHSSNQKQPYSRTAEYPSSNRATTITLLLLLVTAVHLRAYCGIKTALDSSFIFNSSVTRLVQQSAHVFIYQSFLYPRGSGGPVKSSGESTNKSTTIATLFTADAGQNISSLFVYCLYQRVIDGLLAPRELPLLYTRAVVRQALTIGIVGAPACLLRTHVALCEFPYGEVEPAYDETTFTTTNKGSLALDFRDEKWDVEDQKEYFYSVIRKPFLQSRYPSVPLAPRVADTTPRQLVLCVSRVFAFENWRLLVNALEVYRRLGVDLVVTHVLSAVFPLFALMRHYESAGRGGGLLRVKPAVVFPTLRLDAPKESTTLTQRPSSQTSSRRLTSVSTSTRPVPSSSPWWTGTICW